jgi:hypothetical protein
MKRIKTFGIYLLLMGILTFFNNSCKKDSDKSEIVEIGQSYQGGVVAYILRPGDKGYDANVQHGLIAASSDQADYADWGCRSGLWGGSALPGASGTSIGTGNQNTIDIMAGCSKAGIAARLCGDLVLAGYDDWYLPSRDELARLYDNKTAIGGFANECYWSSSQQFTVGSSSFYGTDAWIVWFDDGTQDGGDAKLGPRVRAIRSF